MVIDFLDFIFDSVRLLPMPLETPYAYVRRQRRWQPGDGPKVVWNLNRGGLIDVFEKNNQKFIKLTKKGELKILMQKATWQKRNVWDQKWRLIMFDIPEGSRKQRNLLRKLLKQAGFIKLQESVFISPYELNRQAIDFLKRSGLMEFIRIMRVDDIDDDRQLKKKFNLK